jgi:NADH-quinone oxidoreductase subunit E
MATQPRFHIDNTGHLWNVPCLYQSDTPKGHDNHSIRAGGTAAMTAVMERQHPDITSEMWDSIDAIILANRNKAGAVITVLRECQDTVGYLPVELIDYIGHGMNIPPSDVYGVASFYALFSMVPKGRHTIKICMGTACYVKGIKEVMARIKNQYHVEEGGTDSERRFTLEPVRCLGACGLAPVMVIDQDTHGDISSDKIIDILEAYE